MTSTPIHTLVHIGAGNGNHLTELTTLAPARTVLIEPLPNHANSLRHICPNAEVWELAISCQHNNQPATLTEFNLSEASSLHQPSGLLQLYPGIKAVRQHQVQTQTPATMMAKLQLPEHEQHKLVVEANGEEAAIVEALAQAGLLQQFKQVQLALPATPLYIHEQHTEQLPQLLQSCHFELTKENTDDPDIQVQLWQFNQHSYQLEQQQHILTAKIKEQEQHIAQLTAQLQQEQTNHTATHRNADTLKSQLAELETQYAESSKQNDNLKQALSEVEALLLQKEKDTSILKEKYEEANEKSVTTKEILVKTKSELSKSEKEITIKNHEHKFLQDKISALKTSLDNQEKTNESFSDIQNQMRNLGKSLARHIDKKLVNTAKQIENSIGLQNYFQTGELPLDYHGWPISPDLAIYLIQLIESKPYDLIIEFGSGTSTSIFSKIISAKNKKPSEVKLIENKLNKVEPNLTISSINDLPKRILSIEHNEFYYTKTKNELIRQSLYDIVDLIHAPLVDYTYDGENYLYYSCADVLQNLNDLYADRNLSCLVLVDGPPGRTGPNARFPALPHLLNFLPKAKIDIVLDDYDRQEEKNIVEKWKNILEKRGLIFSENEVPLEKGAIFLSIGQQ